MQNEYSPSRRDSGIDVSFSMKDTSQVEYAASRPRPSNNYMAHRHLQPLPSPPASPAQTQFPYQQPPTLRHAFTPPPDHHANQVSNSYIASSYPAHHDLNQLAIRGKLGSGAYGVVHLAEHLLTGIPYAVKTLSKYNANGLPLDQRQQHFQLNEMTLHYEASAHPNVVSLLRILDSPTQTSVIMEYCPEGDLFANITERGRYVGNDMEARAIFLQIIDAVAYCHSLGIYHRDLKPENILVAEGGRQVKLADFGLATRDPYSRDFGCGSTFYMSPECQNQSGELSGYACAPNDIWSLGVILVNLTCGRNPWKSASAKDSTYREYLKNPNFLKTILPLSDDLNHILGMIFERDPAKRITLDVLRHYIMQCPSFTRSSREPLVCPVSVPVPVQDPIQYSYQSPSTSRGSSSSDGSDFDDSDSMISDDGSTRSLSPNPPELGNNDNFQPRIVTGNEFGAHQIQEPKQFFYVPAPAPTKQSVTVTRNTQLFTPGSSPEPCQFQTKPKRTTPGRLALSERNLNIQTFRNVSRY